MGLDSPNHTKSGPSGGRFFYTTSSAVATASKNSARRANQRAQSGASMLLRIRQRVGRVLAQRVRATRGPMTGSGVTRRLGQTNGGLRLRLNPPLYEAVEVKRQSSQRSPLTTRHISFLVRPGVFLRPGHDFAKRRAQPSSRLAGTVVARWIASYPGHALTTASPVRSLMVGTIGRDRRRT
jgi:hypothetical protein